MGSMCGGATIPGIEVCWESASPSNFESAFRYKATLEPGRLTYGLSIPWPKDFFHCKIQRAPEPAGEPFEWWPASRPLTIDIAGSNVQWDRNWDRSTGEKWANTWTRLGFIVPEAGKLVERQFIP
jgi:hypothetical protein